MMQMRMIESCKPEQQPRFLAAGETGDWRVGLVSGKADGAGPRPHLRLARFRHQGAHMVVGAFVEMQLVELVLREIADLELGARG